MSADNLPSAEVAALVALIDGHGAPNQRFWTDPGRRSEDGPDADDMFGLSLRHFGKEVCLLVARQAVVAASVGLLVPGQESSDWAFVSKHVTRQSRALRRSVKSIAHAESAPAWWTLVDDALARVLYERFDEMRTTTEFDAFDALLDHGSKSEFDAWRRFLLCAMVPRLRACSL